MCRTPPTKSQQNNATMAASNHHHRSSTSRSQQQVDTSATASSHRRTVALSLPICVTLWVLGSFLGMVAGKYATSNGRTLLPPSINEALANIQLKLTSEVNIALQTSIAPQKLMPRVFLPPGKIYPDCTYTTKAFGAREELPVTSHDLVIEGKLKHSGETEQCSMDANGRLFCHNETNHEHDDRVNQNNMDIEEEIHAPAGQHLLIDIKDVDPAFLASEEQLANSMIELVMNSGLTLLSYHCSRLDSTGVSCVGVLLESHIALHTKPDRGTINIDLFTCGEGKLVPLLPLIKGLFEKATPDSDITPEMIWTHKNRGFSLPGRSKNLKDLVYDEKFLGNNQLEKIPVATIETPFQTIEFMDVMSVDSATTKLYKNSLKDDGSYEAQHAEFYKPDRIVFLDKIMQSRRVGQEAHHEALVHPAMLAHDNPKRVAIVGGGEGAILSEVLKHKSVEKAVMIEIDRALVEAAKKYMPEWSDCSNIQGSTASCFEDPRTEILYLDAVQWFKEVYGPESSPQEGFDVIVMDTLDPHALHGLRTDEALVQALSKALGDDGVLVIQLGEKSTSDLPVDIDPDQSLIKFRGLLKESAFVHIHSYEDFHGRFLAPWEFMVAMKSDKGFENWHRRAAQVDVAVSRRISGSVNGEETLRYFDGATMTLYQVPAAELLASELDLSKPLLSL